MSRVDPASVVAATELAEGRNTPQWSPSHPPGAGVARALYIAGVGIIVVVAAGILVLNIFKRASTAREADARAHAVAAGPIVRTTAVELSPGSRTIVLTGESRPFLSVALYAKVSGYLKRVDVDKGDHVSRGQVLALVESPETDQQVEAARADATNKRLIASRDGELIARKLIAPEEAEQAETNARVAQANVARLEAVKDYETIRAPFDGTVTARYADPGALVQNAEGSQTSALPVVEVGTTDSLRIYIYVDQRDAADVRRGSPVTITDPSRPGLHLVGTVSRYTGELDPNTRTLLAEVDVGNRGGAIVPGSMVQVALAVHAPKSLIIPAEALIVRGPRYFVALVGADNTVHFREVHVIDTDGVTVRLADGLSPGDQVALDLGDSVPEGQHVRPERDRARARSVQ